MGDPILAKAISDGFVFVRHGRYDPKHYPKYKMRADMERSFHRHFERVQANYNHELVYITSFLSNIWYESTFMALIGAKYAHQTPIGSYYVHTGEHGVDFYLLRENFVKHALPNETEFPPQRKVLCSWRRLS